MTPHPQRCCHYDVCYVVQTSGKCAYERFGDCASYSTNPHTPAAPATGRLGFTEFCYVHCDKHECCTNECERSAYNAAKAERERLLKKYEEIGDSCPHCDLLYHCPIIESLRGGATDEGGSER